MPHTKPGNNPQTHPNRRCLIELGIDVDGYEEAVAQTLQPTPEEAARIAVDLPRLLEHPAYFDRIMRRNRMYLQLRRRPRFVLSPSAARSPCMARARERRDGSRRDSTRGSPSDESDGDEPGGAGPRHQIVRTEAIGAVGRWLVQERPTPHERGLALAELPKSLRRLFWADPGRLLRELEEVGG
jgi:hypothetical protein